MNNIIQSIETRKNKLYELLKSEDNTILLNKWLKTELSYTSNAIEGNTLTRRETALIIEENITSSSKNINEYLEAKNHAEAFEYIINLSKDDKLIINKDIILNIHKIILKGIDDLNAGFYRSAMVRISGSNTVLPNPIKVPELMNEFNSWLINCNFNSLDNIFDVHYKLVSIHPFIDGNGRTARLLMNLLLMRNNYCPIIIRTIDKKRYLDSLEKYQITGESKEYYTFMLRRLKRSFETIINLFNATSSKTTNKLLTIAKFAKLHSLPVSTVRYWVQIGKIKPISYTNSGYMLFDEEQNI